MNLLSVCASSQLVRPCYKYESLFLNTSVNVSCNGPIKDQRNNVKRWAASAKGFRHSSFVAQSTFRCQDVLLPLSMFYRSSTSTKVSFVYFRFHLFSFVFPTFPTTVYSLFYRSEIAEDESTRKKPLNDEVVPISFRVAMHRCVVLFDDKFTIHSKKWSKYFNKQISSANLAFDEWWQ